MPTLNNFLEKYHINFAKLGGLFFIALASFLDLFFFDFLNFYIPLALLVVFVAYLFKDKLWILLILTPPSLLLGNFLYFEITHNWIYEANLAEIFILVSAAVLLWEKIFNPGKIKLKTDKILWALSAYLFLALLSYFWILDFRLFVYGLKLIILFLLAYFASLNYLKDFYRIKLFLYSLAFTALAISIQIFYKFFQLGLSLDFFLNRNEILISLGPIATSVAVLVMILPALLGLYFWESGRAKPFILLIFLLGVLAVFMSLGKAAALSLFLALVFLFYKFKSKRLVFSLFTFLFLLLAFIFFQSFWEGLLFRLSRVFVDVSSQFRFQELQTCLNIVKNHFLTGVGAGQQIIYYSRYLFPGYEQLVNNFFLQALIDLGVLGLGLVLFIVVSIFRKARELGGKIGSSYRPLFWGMLASLIAVFLNGQVEVTLFALPYGIIFWLFLGGFINLEKNKYENKYNYN